MSSDYKLHSDVVLQQWQMLKHLLSDTTRQVNIDGLHLDISQVICVSRYGFRLYVSPSASQSLEASRDALERSLGQGDIIYGVNTGFGASADLRNTAMDSLQHTLTRELSYGVLPPGDRDHCLGTLPNNLACYSYDFSRENTLETQNLPWSWVRAAILIRINSLIKGCSAVRPVIVERLQDMLLHDLIPMIPLRGSISASGDLSPLAYISGVIQGKSTIRLLSTTGKDVYADSALNELGLTPIALGPKEGLAIVNGTAISTAVATLAMHDAQILAVLAQVLTAMSVEALHGSMESFHPFFAEKRHHPGQFESARNILACLENSKLAKANDGKDGSLRQDRYSIRTASQWLGPALEDLLLAHQQISIECNSATDNPLIDPDGNALHGGNFQAKSVTAAMEKTRQAMQTIGRMLFTQCVEIINPATNRGLPPNLVIEDPSTSGIFKAIDIHIAALQAELGFLAGPVNHVQSAEMGNQALNSLALISACYTQTSINVLFEMAAAHLLTLCQAVDLRAMTMQFFDNYQPEFSLLLAEVLQLLPIGCQSPATGNDLEQVLWRHLLKAFETTTHMDANDRFAFIAKALRSPFIDHDCFGSFASPLQAIQIFTEKLQTSVRQNWCLHQDLYLTHGSASAVLGLASKQFYEFVRHDLKIPFLTTSKIATPRPGDQSPEQAPTVGSYTGVLYRALRNGTAFPILIRVLEEVTPLKQ